MSGWPEGVGRVVLDETDSTNAEARRTVAEPPVWIMARHQTAGRGRAGRSWTVAPGNLAATLFIEVADPPALLARRSFHAALATADLMRALAPGVAVGLKWPNDVLLGGAKVAGILLESFPGTHRPRLAIGIGVNLADAPPPPETRLPAISVFAATGRAPEPEAALDILAAALDRWLRLDAVQGFGPVREAWLADAVGLGQRIEARLPRETLSGVFEDVDADGALILATPEGRRRIAAADIHLPE